MEEIIKLNEPNLKDRKNFLIADFCFVIIPTVITLLIFLLFVEIESIFRILMVAFFTMTDLYLIVRTLNVYRFHIIEISHDENLILIKFYEWFEPQSIRIELDKFRIMTYSNVLRFYSGELLVLTQYPKTFLLNSEWSMDYIKEVFPKLSNLTRKKKKNSCITAK